MLRLPPPPPLMINLILYITHDFLLYKLVYSCIYWEYHYFTMNLCLCLLTSGKAEYPLLRKQDQPT